MSEDTEDTTTEQSFDYEPQARLQGWRPQEEWTGDPDDWKSAEQFVKDGHEINALLKKNVSRLVNDTSQLKQQLSERDELITRLLKNHENDKKEAVEDAIKQLKKEHRHALKEDDDLTASEIEDEIEKKQKVLDDLNSQKDEPVAKKDAPPPEFLDWVDENKWYTEDPLMAADADALGKQLIDSGRFQSYDAVLKAVTRKMKRMYPEAFEDKGKPAKPTSGSPVEGGSRGTTTTTQKKGRTYNDLPADAKAQCDRYVKQGTMTQEDYIKYYDFD